MYTQYSIRKPTGDPCGLGSGNSGTGIGAWELETGNWGYRGLGSGDWALRCQSSDFSSLAAVKRLVVCEELERSNCGNILFYGHLSPPGESNSPFNIMMYGGRRRH